MVVCLCKSVSDHQIRQAIDEGTNSFGGLQEQLQVSMGCGACKCEVERVLDKHLLEANQQTTLMATEIAMAV